MTYSQGMGRHCPCELVSLYTPLDFESSQTSGHNWSNALGTMRGLVCQCTGLSILVLVNGSCCILLGTKQTLAWLVWTSTNLSLIDLNINKPLFDWFEHLQTFACVTEWALTQGNKRRTGNVVAQLLKLVLILGIDMYNVKKTTVNILWVCKKTNRRKFTIRSLAI